jgi:hypothetical protein
MFHSHLTIQSRSPRCIMKAAVLGVIAVFAAPYIRVGYAANCVITAKLQSTNNVNQTTTGAFCPGPQGIELVRPNSATATHPAIAFFMTTGGVCNSVLTLPNITFPATAMLSKNWQSAGYFFESSNAPTLTVTSCPSQIIVEAPNASNPQRKK